MAVCRSAAALRDGRRAGPYAVAHRPAQPGSYNRSPPPPRGRHPPLPLAGEGQGRGCFLVGAQPRCAIARQAGLLHHVAWMERSGIRDFLARTDHVPSRCPANRQAKPAISHRCDGRLWDRSFAARSPGTAGLLQPLSPSGQVPTYGPARLSRGLAFAPLGSYHDSTTHLPGARFSSLPPSRRKHRLRPVFSFSWEET